MDKGVDFGTGDVRKSILRIAVPMTAAQLINVLYNVVDRVYIGHIAGADSTAFTGVGLTFPIITIISAFTNLLAPAARRFFPWRGAPGTGSGPKRSSATPF